MKRLRVGLVLICVSILTAACGSDDKKSEDGVTAGKGAVKVAFDGSEEGSQYLLFPYFLGDSKKIQGGTAENFTFTMTTSTGEAAALVPLRLRADESFVLDASRQRLTDFSEYDHAQRLLLNRYDPQLGENQGAWFWKVARKVDLYRSAHRAAHSGVLGFTGDQQQGSIEAYFAGSPKPRLHKFTSPTALTAADDCPAVGADVIVPDRDSPDEKDDRPVEKIAVTASADFCMVYLSEPVTGGTKAEIEATVQTVVDRYKKLIYNDAFATTTDGYVFKPIVVVADFDTAAGLWPAKYIDVSGAFLKGMSKEAGRPMLYMASDFKKVGVNRSSSSYDAALQKKLWHGTIAHELQHAIINYYRQHVKTGLEENPSVDEGLAHYMEDLFGYGAENFNGFPKSFLDVWANATPFLHQTEDDPVTRGGAQTFLYYLISQKGGIAFTDGVVSGGGGIAFINAVVKNNAAAGPENLQAAFGGTWTETVGNFFTALATDGTAKADLETKYKVQDPATIHDLNGNTNKTYGMHYNGFGGLPAAPAFDKTFASGSKLDEMSYYATTPVLYTVKDPSAALAFTLSDGSMANVAVAKVKLK